MEDWIYILCTYLLGVNLFQIWQFGTTILHYNDMNRLYYSHIYLNPSPAPLDMSLMDTEEYINNEKKYQKSLVTKLNPLPLQGLDRLGLTEQPVTFSAAETWFRIDATINTATRWRMQLGADIQSGDSVKTTRVRLYNPIGVKTGKYAFYIKVPSTFRQALLKVYIQAPEKFNGVVEDVTITRLEQH